MIELIISENDDNDGRPLKESKNKKVDRMPTSHRKPTPMKTKLAVSLRLTSD